MFRAFLEPALFFAAPFVLYTLYLSARLRYPFALGAWSRGTVSLLTLAGLGAAALAVLTLGLLAPRHLGAYIPAHMENGKLVEGQWK